MNTEDKILFQKDALSLLTTLCVNGYLDPSIISTEQAKISTNSVLFTENKTQNEPWPVMYKKCVETIARQHYNYQSLCSMLENTNNFNRNANNAQIVLYQHQHSKCNLILHMLYLKRLILRCKKLHPFMFHTLAVTDPSFDTGDIFASWRYCTNNSSIHSVRSAKSRNILNMDLNADVQMHLRSELGLSLNLSHYKIDILKNISEMDSVSDPNIISMLTLNINPAITMDRSALVPIINTIMCGMFGSSLKNFTPRDMRYALENVSFLQFIRFTNIPFVQISCGNEFKLDSNFNNGANDETLVRSKLLPKISQIIDKIYSGLMMNSETYHAKRRWKSLTSCALEIQVLCTLFAMKEFYKQWKLNIAFEIEEQLEVYLNKSICELIINEYCFQDISYLDNNLLLNQKRWEYIWNSECVEYCSKEWIDWYHMLLYMKENLNP